MGEHDWVQIVLLSLATWRVSYALVYEPGPWRLLTRLRELTGIKHDDTTGIPMAWPDDNIFSCIWCVSIWVALVLWFMPLGVVTIFAISAGAILINGRAR